MYEIAIFYVLTFAAPNRDFRRFSRQIAIFQFPATNRAFHSKADDKIRAFTFKSKGKV